MEDEQRKVAMFEFGMLPQLFHAFGCASLCLELPVAPNDTGAGPSARPAAPGTGSTKTTG